MLRTTVALRRTGRSTAVRGGRPARLHGVADGSRRSRATRSSGDRPRSPASAGVTGRPAGSVKGSPTSPAAAKPTPDRGRGEQRPQGDEGRSPVAADRSCRLAHANARLTPAQRWPAQVARRPARRTDSVSAVAVLLLVEDDPRIRTALTRALTERGHAVASEPAGLPALQPDRRRAAGPGGARPRPARRRRHHAAADAPAGQQRAGDRGHRPGRRRGDRGRARRRRRRLPGQAVQRRAARRPDPGGAAARRPPPEHDRARGRRPRRRRPRPDGGARRPRRWSCGPGSSTCWPTWPPGRARWSPSGPCSPTSGSRRTAGPTRPSTCTCPGCAASSARPPPSRGCCTPCAASA